MKRKVIPIIMGGIMATTVMTAFMLFAPMTGLPKLLIGKRLAAFMHLPVGVGWLLHFIIGTILATMFVIVWKRRLPGSAAVKGGLFALIPFSVAQTVVMPAMGVGFFSINTPAPVLMVISSLLAHLIYGVVLGYVIKRMEHEYENG